MEIAEYFSTHSHIETATRSAGNGIFQPAVADLKESQGV